MKHSRAQHLVAAGALLALAACTSAGPSAAPPVGDQAAPAARSAHPSSIGGDWPSIMRSWKAQSIWVANYHECVGTTTCESLNEVPAAANGLTANVALEIYPAAYPYPYGGIAIDGSQNLWYTSNKMAIVTCAITPGGTCVLGNVIAGVATQLNYPEDVKLDPTGRPTVANTISDTVLTFDLGANGNVVPIRRIAGPNTLLRYPSALAYDPSGNLWVAQSDMLLEFAPGATGNIAPIRTIAGNQTGLIETGGIAIDRFSQIYVIDRQTNRLAMFKESGLGSNVSPDRLWSNPGLTYLNYPGYVAVDDYNIYVTNSNGNSISVFSIDPNSGNAAQAYITGSATTSPLGLALR